MPEPPLWEDTDWGTGLVQAHTVQQECNLTPAFSLFPRSMFSFFLSDYTEGSGVVQNSKGLDSRTLTSHLWPLTGTTCLGF